MGFWDFVKDAGKSVFGTAEAAEPKAQPAPAPQANTAPQASPAPQAQPAPQVQPQSQPQAQPQQAPQAAPAHDADTQRKLDALNAEVRAMGLDAGDVRLHLNGDTVTIVSHGADRETLEKLILAVGNIKGIARVEADLPPAPEGKPAAEPVFHEVRKGETLSEIARQHLGKASRYREIFEANRPMLSDPDKIYPGQKLRIPQD